MGTNCYTLIFTLIVSQSYSVRRQADTLSSSLIHLWYLVSAEEKQGHRVERQCKQRASPLTCLHCFRSGVLCCSGLFRWKRNKGAVLPKYTGGKTEGEKGGTSSALTEYQYLSIYRLENEVSGCGQKVLLEGLLVIYNRNRKVNLKFHSAKKQDF